MDKYNKDIIAINDVGADPKVFHPPYEQAHVDERPFAPGIF